MTGHEGRLVVAAVLVLAASGCGFVAKIPEAAKRPDALEPAVRSKQVGTASWYGPGFHGRRTANGEIYNQHALTAAHRTLRHGSRVRVTNLRNGRTVQVRINDRGPFVRGRVIDLSYGAAKRIGMVRPGTARVRLEILDRARERKPSRRDPPNDPPERGVDHIFVLPAALLSWVFSP